MTHFKNSRKRVSGLILLIIFLFYYSSITFFYHAHLIDGSVISHSHPYKHDLNNKSPFESHSHTTAGYISIQALNHTNWNYSPDIPAIQNQEFSLCDVISYYKFIFVHQHEGNNSILRAPPIV